MAGCKGLEVVPLLRRIAEQAAAANPRAVVESCSSSSSEGGASFQTLSYKDLLGNVQTLSAQIESLLNGRSEGLPLHVAYLVNPSFEYAVTELSVWGAGATCVPLSVHSPVPELEYFVEDSESALLIADTASAPKMRAVAEKFGRPFAIISVDKATMSASLTIEGTDCSKPGSNTPTLESSALILYTSGTTGKPKGVVHTFASLTAQYESLSEAWKWTSKDYTLHVLPLHHIHGVQNILNTALFNGAGVEFTAFDAAFCLKRLCSGDITCFHAVPTIYVKFTQCIEKMSDADVKETREGLRNPALRYMVSGSAALPVPTMKSWADISGHVLLERYGMTEIGMGLSNMIDGTKYPGCVGWALPKVEVKPDEDGAILIKGPCVFKEYYKRPEATQKEFTADGWFRTGDSCQVGGQPEELQALQDAAIEVDAATHRPRSDISKTAAPELAGIYRIMGRTSVDIIKSGGYKLSALEIESTLLQHPAIKECAVVGKPDETWGEKVTAVCVLSGDLTIKELREWGKERMASYKVPQELVVVESLPRNQMGKLEKKKVVESFKNA